MIIDTHYHLIPEASDVKIRSILYDSIRFSQTVYGHADVDALFQKAKDTWLDPDGEKLLAGMDES